MIAPAGVLQRGLVAGIVLVLTIPAMLRALDDIQPDTLEAHTTFLASPLMGGRNTASLEGRIAANYVASHFERLRLLPVGDDRSWFQSFSLNRGWLNVDATALSARIVDTDETFELGRDFGFPQQSLRAAVVRAPLVFAGFAVDAPEYEYSDFKDIDVAGKVVLAFAEEPQQHDAGSRFKGRWPTLHSNYWHKAEQVRRTGAAGLLLIATNTQSGPRRQQSAVDSQPSPLFAPSGDLWDLPVFIISPQAADRLLRVSGRTSQQIRDALDHTGRPASFDLPNVVVTMRKNVMDVETLQARNVVAVLAGADPVRRREHVVVAAHYDHLGSFGDTVFPGADDNASGVAALLEIARALAEGPTPRRSVIFIAFDGEERGLLGSFHYVSHPITALSDTVAMVNLDMIGGDEDSPTWKTPSVDNRNRVNVVGTVYSPDMRRVVEASNESIGLALDFKTDDADPEGWFGRSDHFAFATKSVPIVLFNTGEHPDYHSERDTTATLNHAKQARIARLALATVRRLANDDPPPAFRAR
ncbi:MAG: M28 family peptidase [Vicinamibacterales bacterium]